MTTYRITNCTPDRLRLVAPGRRLEIAPLEVATMSEDPATAFPDATREAADARALVWEPEPVRSTRERMAAGLTLLALGAVAVGVVGVATGSAALVGLAVVTEVAGLAALVLVARRASADGGGDGTWALVRGAGAGLLQVLVALGVSIGGVLLPAVAVYYGTDLSDFLPFEDGAFRLVEGDGYERTVVTGRALQILLIIVLTLVPGLMFFQFDREKGGTLAGRWLHHVFRLDPTLRTLADVDAKYGRRVEESYGVSLLGREVVGLRRRARSPVGVATVLMAIGWTLVLLNELGSDGDETIAGLFTPSRTPLAYAFLGSYFYALQVVLRGFVRGDLRPKTYSGISVRLVGAIVLAWVLEGLGLPDAVVLPAAFFAGIVPDTVIRRVRDTLGGRRDDGAEGIVEASPLTLLDGVDLYERTRLAEEGITNVQALAHHDVVDLTLSTRIPVHRVVDWVDQAVLHQHTTAADRTALRAHGVRGATDLLRVAEGETRADLEAVVPASRLRLVLRTIEDDDWVVTLRAWTTWDCSRPRPVQVYPRPVPPPEPDAVADRVGDLELVRQPVAPGI